MGTKLLVKKAVDGTETYYVHGLGLIGQEKDGDYLSYHFDYRGSTVALTDETGTIVERFLYSPYGLLLNGDASITPFLFNGMYGVMTDDNGLYYMRARYYSPEIRRFVNQDILLGNIFDGQTLNRYAFVTGQPVSFVDPYGLSALVGVWPIAGGILVSDGPLPVGDIIALIIITGAVVYDNVVDSASQCSCNDQETYYHYTSKANLALILESQQLLPSSGPIHARHGGGQYFTDISPEMIAAATISGLTEEQIAAGKISLGQLAQRLFGSAIRRGRKLDTFIEIDLKGCNVVHPIPFIYLVPNDAPLDLTNRIIRFGDVILLPTVR